MEVAEYVARQQFNLVTRWLHGFRYENILGVFGELARQIPDRPLRVLEVGCAHCKLFGLLKERFQIDYLGVDLRPERVAYATEVYAGDPRFEVLQGSALDFHLYDHFVPDIVVALETLEHIPEHHVVRLIEHIASRPSVRFLVVSVPVEVGPAVIIKNVGSALMGYMRHQDYSWRETFWAGLYQLNRLPPHGTRHKGFDWRWLAQTIRHNMHIREIRKSPFRHTPACLAPSVFFVAIPRECKQENESNLTLEVPLVAKRQHAAQIDLRQLDYAYSSPSTRLRAIRNSSGGSRSAACMYYGF